MTVGNFDDLPLIRIKPAPTDAELAAEREAKYRALLAQDDDDDGWPTLQVIG